MNKNGKGSQLRGREGDNAADGEGIVYNNMQNMQLFYYKHVEIQEDALREMVALSSLSTSNGSNLQGGFDKNAPNVRPS